MAAPSRRRGGSFTARCLVPRTLPGVPSQNDATASYLGYVFQGQYALLALWDALDDDVVSVETDDDVVIEGRDTRLAQLKHSLGTPAPLTIANVGIWKTIRIWAEHLSAERPARTSSSGTDRTRYLFVTVAAVSPGDALEALVEGALRTEASITAVAAALTAEATRVRDERAAARGNGQSERHADRAPGCEAFLELSEPQRRRLVSRVIVLPGSFRITDVPAQVERRLGDHVRAAKRAMVAERLIERWDRQVALALMKRRSRRIPKEELVGMVEDLIQEHAPTELTNDFGPVDPDPAQVAADAGGIIEQQIVLVDGGPRRIERAIRDRWRARNQRERWMGDDASLVPVLKAYDDVLKAEWGDLHEAMCHDCRDAQEAERKRRGLEILDWAHAVAPGAVPPLRHGATHSFYVRGMLQQFADDREVGWHPNFLERLGAGGAGTAAGQPSAEGDGATLDSPASTSAPNLRDRLPPGVTPSIAPGHVADPGRPTRTRRRRQAGAE